MSILKSLYRSVKEKVADVFLGEPIKDWGEIYEHQGRFFNETLSIGLYQKDGTLVLWLKAVYRSRFSYNSYSLAFDIKDIRQFVARTQSRYDQLCRLAGSGKQVSPDGRDRLPMIHRLILKVIFGVRASLLLFKQRGGQRGTTEDRFYGFVTRKAETRVFILPQQTGAKQEGTVISGDGFAAVLKVLAEFLASPQAADILPIRPS
jgi:hypothetical protein